MHSSYIEEYQIRLLADAINTLERTGVVLRIPPAEQSPKTGESHGRASPSGHGCTSDTPSPTGRLQRTDVKAATTTGAVASGGVCFRPKNVGFSFSRV